MPNRSNKFWDLKIYCSTFCLNQFCWILIMYWWYVSLQLFSSHLNLKGTGLGYWWFSCMYFNLPDNINHLYIQSLIKVIFSTCSKYCGNLQANWPSNPLLSSKLATFFKLISACVQVSNILVLPVCFKFISFTFQIFPIFFAPKMSTSFTSYIIQTVLDWRLSKCDQERSNCIYECWIVGTLCFWMWPSLPLLTFCHFHLLIHVNSGSQFLVWKYHLSLIWHLNLNRIFLWCSGNWTPAPVPHVHYLLNHNFYCQLVCIQNISITTLIS